MTNKRMTKVWLCLSMALGLFASCYEDKGNYDYISEDDAAGVVLGTLEGATVKANEVLKIEPQMKGGEGDNFSYLWYTLSSGTYNVKKDTLSQERELNVPINLKEGKYTLYYQVTNKSNGVFRSVEAPLTVTATDITSGWYVMKEISGGTDFDYYSLDGKKTVNDFLTSSLGMEPMKGSPVGMVFLDASYNHEEEGADGKVTKETGLSAYHIMSSQDFITLNGSDFSLLKNLQQEFYETPSNINFSHLFIDSSLRDQGYDVDYCYLINNGKLHAMGSEIGKWGYQGAGDYELYPTLVLGYFGEFAYDMKNQMIVNCSTDGTVENAQTFFGSDFTDFKDKDMQVSAVVPHIGGFSAEFYIVAKSGEDGKYYVANVSTFPPYVYQAEYYEYAADSPLNHAKVMASPQTASVIYYAVDNKLYMHKVTTGEDSVVKTFAEGESISFIKNFTGTDKNGESFNDMVVVTNTTTGYQVYQFPMVGSAGELKTDVTPSMSGTGKASYLMFRQE